LYRSGQFNALSKTPSQIFMEILKGTLASDAIQVPLRPSPSLNLNLRHAMHLRTAIFLFFVEASVRGRGGRTETHAILYVKARKKQRPSIKRSHLFLHLHSVDTGRGSCVPTSL
jgi:hypothetical protein